MVGKWGQQGDLGLDTVYRSLNGRNGAHGHKLIGVACIRVGTNMQSDDAPNANLAREGKGHATKSLFLSTLFSPSSWFHTLFAIKA